MNQKPLSLEDICPEDSTLTISDGRTYTVRKFSLEDHAWIRRTFGADNVAQAFQDPESMVRVAFHQLPLEVQKQFGPTEVERVDEETGELVRDRVGGWRLFARSIPSGTDLTKIAEALTSALVGSSALEDTKKKTVQAQSPIGE